MRIGPAHIYLCNLLVVIVSSLMVVLLFVSWTNKKQCCVAVSTTEFEYVVASLATRELIWLRQVLIDIGHSPLSSTPLRCDNQSAINLA